MAADKPRVDQPWPIDIRPGFETIPRPESVHLEVWLDGARVRGVVAVSPETGHVLKYRFDEEGAHVQLGAPPTNAVLLVQPCSCAEGMHRRISKRHCLPYEIRVGKVEIKKV